MAITNDPNKNEVIATSTYYKHALPVFEDMIKSCKTKKKFEEVVNMMETQHYRHVTENGILPHNNTTRSIHMFGKNTLLKGLSHERSLSLNKENNTRIEQN